MAFPKVLNSQQSTTCPNGLAPDANRHCPTSNANQQGGSASNNPTTGHHHKGSNQQRQIGGQEPTIRKHKGSKTEQGTTQSPS